MPGRVVDIADYRNRRNAQRIASIKGFGRLPCPRCDRETEACELVEGGARFVCQAEGHADVDWTYDGMGGVVIDGRARRFITQ